LGSLRFATGRIVVKDAIDHLSDDVIDPLDTAFGRGDFLVIVIIICNSICQAFRQMLPASDDTEFDICSSTESAGLWPYRR
jgi:hypothetical protein